MNQATIYLTFILVIMSCSSSFIVQKRDIQLIDEESNSKYKNIVLKRRKRSLADFLDTWINTIALTGLRIGYHPYRYIHDIFGNHPQV